MPWYSSCGIPRRVMSFKRLYYDFAVHGGALGFIDLMQGSSYRNQLLLETPFAYVFDPMLTATDWDLGTALQPQLLVAGTNFQGASAGDIILMSRPLRESLYTSPWGITFHTDPETAGRVEFIFDSHRRI
jgi:hypothetical protein